MTAKYIMTHAKYSVMTMKLNICITLISNMYAYKSTILLTVSYLLMVVYGPCIVFQNF